MVNQSSSDNYCPKCGKRLVSQASYCANCGTRVFRDARGQDTSDPYLGQVIENTFEIQSILGTGTMGIVYKAYNRAFNNYVALKVLRHDHLSDRVLLTRFQREAQAVSSLEHPNVIKIFHFGRTHLNAPYIAMECLNGTELAVLVPKEFPLNQQRVCSFTLQVARALSAAHRASIIHRDLKPANIVVVNDNGQEIVKVLDFGIAKIADVEGEGLTREGDICGTPAFMSPEQIVGRAVTPASDIFSLGSIMYYMLTCKLPFSGTSMADMAQSIMLQDPTPPVQARMDAHVHPRLSEICMKALEKHIEHRYQTADEMIADLEAAMPIVNDPSAYVKPKIVVGNVNQTEDLSGETCCEINAYDDEAEEDGTLVEMPAMPDDSDMMRTGKNNVPSTVGSAVGYVLSQVMSLKQDTQIGAGEKTVVHGYGIADNPLADSEDIVEHRKKLLLGWICIFIGCCLFCIFIFAIIHFIFFNDDDTPEPQTIQDVAEKTDKVTEKTEEPKMDHAEILYKTGMASPQTIRSLAIGTVYGVAFDANAIFDNTEVVDDSNSAAVGEPMANGEHVEAAATNGEHVETADTPDDTAPKTTEEPKAEAPKPVVKEVKKSSAKKSSSKKSSSKKSTTSKSSTSKDTAKTTTRRSASASSDAATSKLKAAQKAEAEGNKVKACSIYKALHEGNEPLSQADRVKIMSKVRGCSRITI